MSDSSEEPIGSRLGDFQIVREIGRGGMGVVYEAEQLSLKRRVAVKVLPAGLCVSPTARERFHREAQAAAKLHHSHIVAVYSEGEEKGTCYFAMELVNGSSLDTIISGNQGLAPTLAMQGTDARASVTQDSTLGHDANLSDSRKSRDYFDGVARWTADIASALDYAHQQGVVHRDVKPSNLILGTDGRMRLMDFGLARILHEPGMTMSGELLGTPRYMSPEQIAAGRTSLDHRTDIYSLGATMYELLTLRPPFVGEHRDQLLTRILQLEPTPPRRIDRKIPVDLETICLKAMDKNPERRYQTAAELAEDLERYVHRFAISARRLGVIGRAEKWLRRHPSMAAGSVIALVALLVAAFFANQAYWTEQRRQNEQDRAAEQLRVTNLQTALERATVAATSGDLSEAMEAIQIAEELRATPAQLCTLRGQVAYFRGEYEAALRDLTEAVRLEPEAVAPRALLTLTHADLGRLSQYVQDLVTLETLEPESALDFIFKGYAKYWSRPDQGLALLDEAVLKSRSPLARAIRADVALNLADLESDIGIIESALNDIRVARDYLPDNPFVLSIDALAHTMAAKLYQETDQSEAARDNLVAAEEAVAILAEHNRLPYPAFALYDYFRSVGSDADLVEHTRTAADTVSNFTVDHRHAVALTRAGRFSDALTVLDEKLGSELDGGWLRAYLLAELSPHDLSSALSSMDRVRRELSTQPLTSHLLSPQEGFRRALLTLGLIDEAVESYRAVVATAGSRQYYEPFEEPMMLYGAGRLTDGQLLRQAAEGGRWDLCGAHLAVALNNLARGKRDVAKRHLRELNALGVHGDSQYEIACTFIKRFEDHAWPPWIRGNDDGSAPAEGGDKSPVE